MDAAAAVTMPGWKTLLRPLKYEDLKIREYVLFPQLKMGVRRYVNSCNVRRIHTAMPDCARLRTKSIPGLAIPAAGL